MNVTELVNACHFLSKIGLGTSTSGNCSARVGDQIYLTATGCALADVTPDNLAVTDLRGNRLNDVKPTKEIGFHLAIFEKLPGVNSIVHVHPANGIVVSTLLDSAKRQEVPAITPQFVMRCGRVPVLPYHPPGSDELTGVVADSCTGRRTLLLQNHGAIAFAENFKKALGILEELEENCRLWVMSRPTGRTLNETEVAVLLNRTM